HLSQSNYADRIAAGKKIDHVAKIFVVVASDDGNAVECWFKNVVSAARHQAATDERDRGQRIERSQLPDAIDQKHAASERFAVPQRTTPHPEAELLDELPNLRKTLRMAGRKDHHGLRMIRQNIAKRRKQRAFFVLERAAAHQNRPRSGVAESLMKTRNDCRRWRRRHIEFQVASTRNFRFARSNFYQPPPVFFGLGQKNIHVSERLLQQSRK